MFSRDMNIADFDPELYDAMSKEVVRQDEHIDLIASENYEDYMYSLVEAYNPSAVANVMCRNTISVSWDGWLYDCDFNQMLGLKVASKVKHLKDYNEELLQNRKISTFLLFYMK